MTDKELLELAAKAVGEKVVRPCDDESGFLLYGSQDPWNPLTDDGDALRLAVKLKVSVLLRPYRVEILSWPKPDKPVLYGFDDGPSPKVEAVEPYDNDPYAATRRAIVRAAAAMGRNMK